MRTVKKGDTVKINYKGYFREGSIFSSTIDSEPLQVKIGEGSLLPGFEQALLGMSEKEKKTIRIIPDREAGLSQKELVREEDSGTLPEHEKLNTTQDFETFYTEGETLGVNVRNPMSDRVHENKMSLSGKELFYDIELIKII